MPFVAPKKYWDLYKRSDIKLSPNQEFSKGTPVFAFQASGELTIHYLTSAGTEFKINNKVQEDSIQRELIHGYYASISYADALVGKLLDALTANNLTKNTIIVLWGDHGWHLGDHTMWCKHSNFEQATNAPLIISSPNLNGNNKVTGLTEFVDVFPTLTELAGLKTPEGLAGISLVKAMKNPNAKTKEFAQSQYPRKMEGNKGADLMGYAIRTEKFRYVAWYKEDYYKNKVSSNSEPVAIELYDYDKDPNETQNYALDEKYSKIVSKHQKLMVDFLSKQNQSR